METRQYPERSTGEIIRLGLAGRCPRCAEGRIFEKYLKVADGCPVCGLTLRESDVGDAAVVPLTLVIGAFLVGVGLWVEVAFEPPLWAFIAILAPFSIGLTALLLPRVNGLTVALQYRYRSTEEPTKPGGA
ncbi:MAG: DUF983 domain-containing protein [Rhodospirillales bacterium]